MSFLIKITKDYSNNLISLTELDEMIIKYYKLKQSDKLILDNQSISDNPTILNDINDNLKKNVSSRSEGEVANNKFLILLSEFENYKKRTSKERLDLYKSASQELMTALLPIVDDLTRAYKEFEKSKERNLVEGMSLIKNKFSDVLKSQGLILIDVNNGDDFDVEIHEAIAQIPAENDKMKGKIIDVIESGYKLGDKIIRYSKVVVGN
ncbi:nucleotide exchange factor GrpE [Flavobacteriaceae bacterium]|nr:nucleotide exchange factor GrpE [Flavobacteriaceae bacterium]